MDIKVEKSDLIWSYLGVILSFTASVISLPIVIYFLDGDMLGLWYVFGSVGAITLLFDFGFTVTFARNITYCWSGASKLEKTGISDKVSKEVNYQLMRDILYASKKVYFIIAIIAYVLMLTAGTAYILYISKHISGYTHIIAWIVYSTGAFLNLYYNYFDSFLRGVGAIKQANQSKVIARTSQLILMVLLLSCGMGILGLAIASFVFGIVFRITGRYFFYNYKNIGENLSRVTAPISKTVVKNIFKTIWYNAWKDGVIGISIYLGGQASVIICSLYLSLTETATYSIGLQIAEVVKTLSKTMYDAYQPSLQSNWVKNNLNEVKRIMNSTLKVYSGTYFIGVLGIISVGLPLLRLIKPDVILPFYIMLGIFLSVYIIGFRDCFTSYFSSTNRLIYMPAHIASSLLCILITVVLMQFFDLKIWGLIIGQITAQLLYNIWYWPLKAYGEMNQVNRQQ